MIERIVLSVAASFALVGGAPAETVPTEAPAATRPAVGFGVAIVTGNAVILRAAARDSAPQQAVLSPGEMLEVRGERLDWLQVYDYGRERGGFVRSSDVRRTRLAAEEAGELLSLVRFLRDRPDSEALGIGFAMAYVQAAPSETMRGADGVEVLDALGRFADRLAARASAGARNKAAETALAAHLDVAGRYGMRFTSFERAGRMHVCYDGDAYRRVLALKSGPEARAHAALALTRQDCIVPETTAADRTRIDAARAELLERVDTRSLPAYLANRIDLRRAIVWSTVAFDRARATDANTTEAARRALAAFAAVRRGELADEDASEYNDAAMRASIARWAAAPAVELPGAGNLALRTERGGPGETCIVLEDTGERAPSPNSVVALSAVHVVSESAEPRKSAKRESLARRCTFGLVWTASAQFNRERNAVAVAVQPTDAWLELWVFRKVAKTWTVQVLPPAASTPGTGYAEWAGWVPGGARMLVAREARGEGRYRRRFEVLQLATLAVEQEGRDPESIGAFQRWQSATWKAETLSLR